MIKTILLSLFLISSAFAENKMQKISDSFSDKVKMVKETPDGLNLHFELHAAIYKINKKNPNFEQLKKTIEGSQAENKEIKVVAEIPAMEIVSAK